MTTPAAHPRAGVAAVLIAVLICLIAVEGMARFVIPRASKVESRVVREAAEARALLAQPGERPRLLVVGNSLVEAGVDPALLADEAHRIGWEARRFPIEATNYLDWYIGLRRLFVSSGRPEAALVIMSPRQFVATPFRGTYSAYHLMTPADAVEAGVRSRQHPTETSGFVLGTLSAFYGLRTEIRQFFLQRLIPGMQQVADLIANQTFAKHRAQASEPSDAAMAERLAEFKAMCDGAGVRCMLSFAKELEPAPAWVLRLEQMGQDAGLSTVDLRVTARYDASDFGPDRYHMSEAGAHKYTPDLVARLARLLGASR